MTEVSSPKLDPLACASLALLALDGRGYYLSGLRKLLELQNTVALDKDSLMHLEDSVRRLLREGLVESGRGQIYTVTWQGRLMGALLLRDSALKGFRKEPYYNAIAGGRYGDTTEQQFITALIEQWPVQEWRKRNGYKVQEKIYRSLVDSPMGMRVFARLDPDWQADVLVSLLPSIVLMDDGWEPEQLQALIAKPLADPRYAEQLRLLLMEQSLLDGDSVLAREVAGNSRELVTLMNSIEKLLDGDPGAACAGFRAALPAWRKRMKRQKIYFDTISDWCFGLALLLAGEPDARTILAELRDVWNRRNGDVATWGFGGLLDIAEGKVIPLHEDGNGETLFLTALNAGRICWLELTTRLFSLWRNGSVQQFRGAAEQPVIRQMAGMDPDADPVWLRRQAIGLARALSGQAADCTLVRLSPRLEPWQRMLQRMQEVAFQTRDEGHGTQRIIWQLEHAGRKLQITSKIQKWQLNSGNWTAGRRIDPVRLQYDDDVRSCADDPDRDVIAALRGIREYWYGSSGLLLDESELVRLLPVLQTHPRIFNGDGQPLTIIEGTPLVHVSRRTDGIRLAVRPKAAPGSTGLHYESKGNQLIYYRYPSALETLAALFREYPEALPEVALPELQAALAKLPASIKVLSQVEAVSGNVSPGGNSLQPNFILALHGGELRIRLAMADTSSPELLFPIGNGPDVMNVEGRVVVRDLAAERMRARALCKQLGEPFIPPRRGKLPTEWCWGEVDEVQRALGTLYAGLEQGDCPYAVSWEGERNLTPHRIDIDKLSLSIAGTHHWLSVSGEVALDDEQVISLQELLRRYQFQPLIRLEGGEILLLSERLRRLLGRMQGLVEEEKEQLTISSARALPLKALLEETGEHLHSPALANRFPVPALLSATLAAPLRDYQRQGVEWIRTLSGWGLGACLADDMGLGKTLQALTWLAEQTEAGPGLVICPKSVCMNWSEEASRFTPGLEVIQLDGVIDREVSVAGLGPRQLLVVSYGLLLNARPALMSRCWAAVVLDEAQAVKNPASQRAKLVAKLAADSRLALTGTPIENHLGELWSLFRFLNPGLLGSRQEFQRQFATPISRGDSQAAERLQTLVRPFVLRRLKRAVLTELPEKTEITLHVPLSQAERHRYEAIRRTALEELAEQPAGGDYISVLAAITRLRRCCCHPQLVFKEEDIPSSKLNTALELIDELQDGGHRALVFSQFVDHLTLLRQALDTRKLGYCYLDGQTPVDKRRQEVKRFQKEDGPPLFLISLKAGGTGLNLTRANYVIHLDPWWNPAVEDQASDRAHRIGQHNPVTVYRLVTENTIEEKILALHASKRELADQVLAGTDSTGALNAEALKALLTESALSSDTK